MSVFFHLNRRIRRQISFLPIELQISTSNLVLPLSFSFSSILHPSLHCPWQLTVCLSVISSSTSEHSVNFIGTNNGYHLQSASVRHRVTHSLTRSHHHLVGPPRKWENRRWRNNDLPYKLIAVAFSTQRQHWTVTSRCCCCFCWSALALFYGELTRGIPANVVVLHFSAVVCQSHHLTRAAETLSFCLCLRAPKIPPNRAKIVDETCDGCWRTTDERWMNSGDGCGNNSAASISQGADG